MKTAFDPPDLRMGSGMGQCIKGGTTVHCPGGMRGGSTVRKSKALRYAYVSIHLTVRKVLRHAGDRDSHSVPLGANLDERADSR